MKEWLKRISLLVSIIVVAVFVVASLLPEQELSLDQEEIVELFGHPHQFVITYMPSGDEKNPTLARSEVWYYPNKEMQITFVGGDVFNVEDYISEDPDISATTLKPEDFEFEMDLEMVSEILGSSEAEPLDFLPGYFEEGELETYISDKALFIIERDKLSYIQSIGLGTQDFEDTDLFEEIVEEIDEPVDNSTQEIEVLGEEDQQSTESLEELIDE